MSIYLGIDPGKTGYVCAIDECGTIGWHKTPIFKNVKGGAGYDQVGMWNLIAALAHDGIALATIETQQPYPSQGGVSNFTTGFGFGLWCMALTGNHVKRIEPRPKEWQRMFFTVPKLKKGQKRPANYVKGYAMSAAQKLFPHETFKISQSGKFDSLLIAEFARRMA